MPSSANPALLAAKNTRAASKRPASACMAAEMAQHLRLRRGVALHLLANSARTGSGRTRPVPARTTSTTSPHEDRRALVLLAGGLRVNGRPLPRRGGGRCARLRPLGRRLEAARATEAVLVVDALEEPAARSRRPRARARSCREPRDGCSAIDARRARAAPPIRHRPLRPLQWRHRAHAARRATGRTRSASRRSRPGEGRAATPRPRAGTDARSKSAAADARSLRESARRAADSSRTDACSASARVSARPAPTATLHRYACSRWYPLISS
jgi:hypothetical protein